MGKHEVRLSTTIQAPPDKVWAVITNPSNYPKWMKHIHHVESKAKTLKKGARFTLVSMTSSKNEISVEVEVTEFDAPRRLAWKSVRELWNGEPQGHVSDVETAFDLVPSGKATNVEAHGGFLAKSLKAKLGAGILLSTKVKPELEKALEELKKTCE